MSLLSVGSFIKRSLADTLFSSALAAQAGGLEVPLIDALAKSKDVVTYISSAFVNAWTHEQLADHPKMRAMDEQREASIEHARQLGFGVTRIRAALFAEFFFGFAVSSFVPYEWRHPEI